jgi:hypothetical protein
VNSGFFGGIFICDGTMVADLVPPNRRRDSCAHAYPQYPRYPGFSASTIIGPYWTCDRNWIDALISRQSRAAGSEIELWSCQVDCCLFFCTQTAPEVGLFLAPRWHDSQGQQLSLLTNEYIFSPLVPYSVFQNNRLRNEGTALCRVCPILNAYCASRVGTPFKAAL